MKQKREITLLVDVALITCIVQRDVADNIIRIAKEAGAQGSTVHFAKGTGISERLGILSFAVDVDKEVINIVVASDQVHRIFETIYLEGKLDVPGRGFMYITPLEKAATYIPHEIRQKLQKKNKIHHEE